MKLRNLFITLALIMLPVVSFAKETKNVSFPLKNANAVIFSHDVHLRKLNNNCRLCHNAIYNLRVKRHFTMAEMEKGKSCGACHSGVKAFSVKDNKTCVRCHKGQLRTITFNVKGATPAIFAHNTHISNGLTCRDCHNGKTIISGVRGTTMAMMNKGKSCGACHNGNDAFASSGDCAKCHIGFKPGNLTFKTSAGNANFSHDFHLGMYKCADCHTKIFPYQRGTAKATMAMMNQGKSCGACHNGNDAFATNSGDCAKCHTGFKPGNITFKTDGGDATFSHDFHLGMYKCADCHTKIFPYQTGVVKATMADMEKGKSCGACHNGKDAFASSGDCEKCHKM
ncbi:MAG: cytochrome c3 family protein [Desulfuromonadales bacterium]|nr:cytochrome c3 family protein [Desulfuromonadales bacterium]